DWRALPTNIRTWSMRRSARLSVGMRILSQFDNAVAPVIFQAVPEDRDGIEDFTRAPEEPGLVEIRIEEDLFELLHRVAGVLGFDAVVPGEKGDFQRRQPGRLDLEQAVLQLLPEARRGPVLDGEAGSFGDLAILIAIKPLQFIAEPEGIGTAVPALA